MLRAYCETCDWSYEIDEHVDRSVLDRAMIDHHAETGHSVVADDALETPAPDDRVAAVDRDARAEQSSGSKRNR